MARILALTSRVPWPPREGHQLRSYHVLDALASMHQVHLLSCARQGDDLGAGSLLRSKLSGFETFPIPAEHSRAALAMALAKSLPTTTPFVSAKYAMPSLTKRVAQLAHQFDLIHVDMLPLMTHVATLSPVPPLVLNAHNVEHSLLQARIRVEPRLAARMFLRAELPKLQEFERAACRLVKGVLACSAEDAQQLRRLAPHTPVHVVPNGVDLEWNRPASEFPDNAMQMVFVGQMNWFPNRDGMQWFLDDIMPRIVAARPEASLLVIGRSEGFRVPETLASRVHLAGFVPDMRPLVRNASVYIVPLRAGSGTRLKVLEAMALRKAIVTTRIGAEGIDLEPGRDACFADDAEAFANSVLQLFDNPGRARRLGEAARRAAEARYGWKAIGDSILQLYDSLLADGSRSA